MNLNKTGIPELDALIKAVSKKFGKDLSPTNYGDIETMTTGSVTLDSAIGGGFPVGHITEIFGWESSGKTSLALQALALRQQYRRENNLNKRDLIIDLEYSLTSKFIQGFGIDLEQVLWIRPDTAEEALQLAIDLPKSGAIDVVIFDSVDAAQNTKMLSRNVGETDVGGISKDMNFAMRQISKIGPKTNTTYIFINQIKQNPGVMMGNPNVTPGGNALKFYAMLRLELMSAKISSNIPDAMQMRIKLAKTKISSPIGKDPITVDFIYGKGFDPVLDLISHAKSLGVIKHAGPTTKVVWREGEDEETLCGGGKKALYDMLLDKEEFDKLKRACLLKQGLIQEEE